MQQLDFCPWEKRISIEVQTLKDIAERESESQVSSLDQIVRIERRLGMDIKSESAPTNTEGKYLEDNGLRVAYDHYYSEFLVDKDRSYLIARPFLIVFLNAEYKNSEIYLKGKKLAQDPSSLTLRPADIELANFLFRSQIVSQVQEIEDRLKLRPSLYITRGDLPSLTFSIGNLELFIKETRRVAQAIGYHEEDPNSTEYVVPGQKMKSYTEEGGFAPINPLLRRIRAV